MGHIRMIRVEGLLEDLLAESWGICYRDALDGYIEVMIEVIGHVLTRWRRWRSQNRLLQVKRRESRGNKGEFAKIRGQLDAQASQSDRKSSQPPGETVEMGAVTYDYPPEGIQHFLIKARSLLG